MPPRDNIISTINIPWNGVITLDQAHQSHWIIHLNNGASNFVEKTKAPCLYFADRALKQSVLF